MSRPGLVIFDCDGVLVDTETLANRRLSTWLSEAGYAISYEDCRRTFCGRSMKSVQEEVESKGVSLGDFVERWYRELPGLFEDGLEAIPHVETAVLALKHAGIPWCVASSANVEKMHLTLGKTGLLVHFEQALFSASMVERGKPFPDLFLHAALEMGFAPADCVVVEDAVPGVKAARAAGMRVFGYHGDPLSDREGLAGAGATLFDDMRDLPGLLGLVPNGSGSAAKLDYRAGCQEPRPGPAARRCWRVRLPLACPNEPAAGDRPMTTHQIFRALHDGPGAFVIPNPWDIGTAKLLAHLGFKALATTSAGYAFSRGLPDGGVPFEEMIDHCRELVAATDLPVSADLENGKGDSPESAAETIFAAEKVGLAGCSIEDYSGAPDKPIYEFDLAVERVAAAVDAARALDRDFVFTARAENLLRGVNDLDDTIRRLQAFEKAGADVLYAPGIGDIATVRTICSSVSKPVNILAQPHFTLAELNEAGARRISLGSKLTTAVFGALRAAAREILEKGTFGFVAGEMPFGELQKLFGNQPAKPVGRGTTGS